LETATAGDCGKLYNIRPIDRGMLEFKRKRLENGLVCKLYLRMDVLKVARSVHSKKQASTISILKKVCAQLGVPTNGTYKELRNRISLHMMTI